MAKKISQLTQATQVKSDDVTVIVQDGETKKLPLNMMVTKQDIENKKIAGLAKLDEIEATYENDTYTPTITVKNKSSVKTGEGDEVDYSANVMDGHAKSAILKGQTLIDLKNSFENGTYAGGVNKFESKVRIRSVNKFTEIGTFTFSVNSGYQLFIQGYNSERNEQWESGWNSTKTLVTTSGDIFGIIIKRNDEAEMSVDEFERIGFTTNLFISGDLVSVKMPVLTTTGKNLFDGEIEFGTLSTDTGKKVASSDYIRSVNFIPIGENKRLTISNNMGYTWYFYAYDSNFNFIERFSINSNIPENCKYIKFRSGVGGQNSLEVEIQIEEGTIATPYEPYKSNILSTSEDVVLRGIGKVRDELDLLTGEVTERIGEVVLNGSEDWKISELTRPNHLRLYLQYPNLKHNQRVINSRFPDIGNIQGRDVEGVYITNTFDIQVEHSRLSEVSVVGFKQWLSQNPITVQYQLKTESIKTVDLMPSGTHPSTTPYCWKNGHIQLSSSGLLPNLEYNVVTSRAGQINQNATMIVKNDKRIFDLEILLAGGLVNTTYQALTLQNQVETGLSKVSLNSETEPDYLLYHMIMKLIEEKAYKLDDLTEKVSVFYLYEKLSDEQFETIYSALYPFVEDEIVEEPVVEELPEVVEDEVIM
jgi:hypothetical protein